MASALLVFLGLLCGLYASFVGTTGGAAILIFLLQYLNVLGVTAIAGTMLFISALPLGIFGLYEYYKHGEIDYYVAGMIIIGLVVGLFVGSQYAFIVNAKLGEKTGDQIKNGLTALVYGVLTLMYSYLTVRASSQ
jgi:uncharacterized membrane protein YfcA